MCKFSLPEEENIIIDTILKTGILKLYHLINRYNDLTTSYERIDIFEDLEKIYLEMDEPKKQIEPNRYYKHICTKNQICQRSEDQAIYIDLIKQEVNYNFDNELNYDPEKLKTDQNYKDNIVKKRIEVYNSIMKKQRKKEIERMYIQEFEAHLIDKDHAGIYKAKQEIKWRWEDHIRYQLPKRTGIDLFLSSKYNVLNIV